MTEMRNVQAILDNEKAEALAVFNVSALQNFLYLHADDYVGERNGVKTTLIEEVSEVIKLAHKAYMNEGINYYNGRQAMRMVEFSEEEISARRDNNYLRAGKKILFLNGVSKRLTGRSFIKNRIDKENIAEVTRIVDSFEWIVRHYDEV